MIDLLDIHLDEFTEEIVISFDYTGEQMEFRGSINIDVEKYTTCKMIGINDRKMISAIVKNELKRWIID